MMKKMTKDRKPGSGFGSWFPFVHISSSNKTITLQSTSTDVEDISIKGVSSPEFKLPGTSGSSINSPHTPHGTTFSTLSHHDTLKSSGSGGNTPTTNTPTASIPRTTITERDIEKALDDVKIIEEPEEEKVPKEIECVVSFQSMNKIIKLNSRGSLEDATSICKRTLSVDEFSTVRLDVFDPRIEEFVVLESMDHLKKCKPKLSTKLIKLRLEVNKTNTSFEDQMGWVGGIQERR